MYLKKCFTNIALIISLGSLLILNTENSRIKSVSSYNNNSVVCICVLVNLIVQVSSCVLFTLLIHLHYCIFDSYCEATFTRG